MKAVNNLWDRSATIDCGPKSGPCYFWLWPAGARRERNGTKVPEAQRRFKLALEEERRHFTVQSVERCCCILEILYITIVSPNHMFTQPNRMFQVTQKQNGGTAAKNRWAIWLQHLVEVVPFLVRVFPSWFEYSIKRFVCFYHCTGKNSKRLAFSKNLTICLPIVKASPEDHQLFFMLR